MATLELESRPMRQGLISPLYETRLSRDVSLIAVAAAVGMAPTILLDMEWQLHLPTRAEAERLAAYYGTSVEALFGRVD
jgi:hypothetical protein